MRLSGEHTPDGYVVRRIQSHGEDAYRMNTDGSVSWSAHNGPWVGTSKLYTPADVLRLMDEAVKPKPAEGG